MRHTKTVRFSVHMCVENLSAWMYATPHAFTQCHHHPGFRKHVKSMRPRKRIEQGCIKCISIVNIYMPKKKQTCVVTVHVDTRCYIFSMNWTKMSRVYTLSTWIRTYLSDLQYRFLDYRCFFHKTLYFALRKVCDYNYSMYRGGDVRSQRVWVLEIAKKSLG